MLEIDLEDPYTKEQLDNIIEFENTMIICVIIEL